ncbi:hypothetical protein [Marinobacterium weihaiense]|uniref:PRTRC system protein F n=1 Tax=Marinobacterium weihaiense TaxID=2851016 RepID=A0ABS6MEN9_9GAMM|nr:hypothetical protein [Marinobacterium weihaiense]MBV0934779.1 hypothetical protein [Marinobacterium weihaiense]
MQLNKECQTTETASTIRTSAPDSAATRLLSSATALKPPHLALVGQTVERLEGITAGDKEIVSTQRGGLSALLRFGVTHGLTNESELLALLNAPYIEQPDHARSVLRQTFSRLADVLGDELNLFVLSPTETGYMGGTLGIHIEPTDLVTLIRCQAPDPLLVDWFHRFGALMSDTLGFYTASDIADYELDMSLDCVGIDAKTFEKHRDRIEAMLETESTEEICTLLEVTAPELEEMWGEGEVTNALTHCLELSRMGNRNAGDTPDTFQGLRIELNALVEKYPRFAYEPTVKELLNSLPEIAEAAALYAEYGADVLEPKGDRFIGEQFMVVNADLPDSGWQALHDHEMHFFEAGETGCWSVNHEHPKAIEVTRAYLLLCSKFLDVCDYQ